MKTIKTDNVKEGIRNFVESFRDSNDDVTRFGSEKLVNGIVDRKNKDGFSSTKISDRRITSGGVR
jgi:hypothetical protein